ncbi:hypothetical protein [Streptomyces sp. NPDC001536]|uniref:hypothetical protein n=1 Tax=Streptomyces sp. NPDC001536 TaxID=3364583 RepID=UPI003692E941
MTDSAELAEWEFIGRRGGDRARLVPGEVVFAVPAVKALAEEATRALRFDFFDDRAVLKMLRQRHDDELAMFDAGVKVGVPLAIVGFGAVVYWGGVAQYWESGTARYGYLAATAVVVLVLISLFFRSVVRHWGDPVRQNLRARARKYRELAHVARRGGADIPAHYPHYGPYPFAANFHPDVADSEFDEDEGRT